MNTFTNYTDNLMDIMSADGVGFLHFRMFVESCIANKGLREAEFLKALNLVNKVAGNALNGFESSSSK